MARILRIRSWPKLLKLRDRLLEL